MKDKSKTKRFGKKANYELQIIGVGALTGLFAGLIVTLYGMLVNMCEEFSRHYYGFFRDNPAFIPLLFLALFAGSIVIGGVLKFIPMIRGSGIPQTEGATRGVVKYKWWQVLPAMFASSLFCIFMGLSAGGEGPSIMIGGACGYGMSDILKRNATVRRYSVTGGACAGLAVAFNAPLTGMAFAFEEAHKRFTPEVFVCAFSSVVIALLTRNIFGSLIMPGYNIQAVFSTFVFEIPTTEYLFYLYVLFASVIVSLIAIGFYRLLFLSKRLFAKLKFWKGMGKMIIPFLLGGAFALVTVNVMGGGHEFIESLGSLSSEGVERLFSSPVWVTLLVVIILKLILTVLNLGAGVPCGIFIPMLAIGAGLGALLSRLCVLMGMSEVCSDVLVMICMSAFFTAVVKAPITGIVMVVELTWNFTFLLPAILGVAVGYLMGNLFRTEPLYDKLLDLFLEENATGKEKREVTVRVRVLEGSLAAGRTVRDVLWPAGVRITLIEHNGKATPPSGHNALLAGDILTAVGETTDEEDFTKLLVSAVGELIEETSEEIVGEPPEADSEDRHETQSGTPPENEA